MAWTTPKTWRDGHDRGNAANLNTYIRDNQLALREQAAGLDGRIQHLELGGFSDAMMRSLSLPRVANRIVLSDLTPPAGTALIYLAYFFRSWGGGLFLDYDVWDAFPEYDATDSVPESNRFQSGGLVPYVQDQRWRAYVTKGTAGVLAFGGSSNVTRVCVRWYT